MEFYKSYRGGDVCMYQGYEYLRKRQLANGNVMWRCRQVNKFRCNATIVIDGGEILSKGPDHTHLPDLPGAKAKLRQAVQRNVQTLGLKTRYEQDMEFTTLVRSMTALAFVPLDEVAQLFEELTTSFPDEAPVNELLSYFKATYVSGGELRRPPMFPIPVWNHYDDAINKEAKTTNCVEGWHNALRSLFLSSHPSIWKVLRGLRKDIAVQRLSIIQAVTENGDRPKDKYKRLADRLSSKVECYAHEQDKMKYLRGVSYMT